jgi:hypothetical protein
VSKLSERLKKPYIKNILIFQSTKKTSLGRYNKIKFLNETFYVVEFGAFWGKFGNVWSNLARSLEASLNPT